MINEEKVKLMTKLAIYESTKGKKQLNISKYYKRDYVRYNMFKTAVSATIAFLLLLGVYAMLNMEELLLALNDMDILKEAEKLGIFYLIFLIAYMVIARLVYVIQYNHNLKKLKEMYDKEEKELREKQVGRSVTLTDDDLIDY